MIIIISIFKENDVFSITAILPYGPLVNTDTDYYRIFFQTFLVHLSRRMGVEPTSVRPSVHTFKHEYL